MRPVLTAAEQRAADRAAMRTATHETLVERAGLATSIAAADLLPRVYGARVAVLCGPGSNGEDGRVAARLLGGRGAACAVVEVASAPALLDGVDLVVDAAFGTGLSRPWDAPVVPDEIPVLAVDLPSGVDPDTGVAGGRAIEATASVAMGSLKRGHVLADGAALSGELVVAPLGIEPEEVSCALIEDDDLDAVAPLGRDEHKWRRALLVVGGAPGMVGAPGLACDGALAAQAGMVLCCVPGAGGDVDGHLPREVVRVVAAEDEVVDAILARIDRTRATVLGPGLGRGPTAARTVAALVARAPTPLVLDADALHLVDAAALRARDARLGSVVLTPHDGEYEALCGVPPGSDRFAAASRLAAETGCTVLLKGPTTAVASAAPPDGVPATLAVTAGTPDLATPGTGDVLAGVVGALLARGIPAHLAAALAAHLHGRAGGALGARCRAGALPGAIAALLESRRAGVPSW